jgi:hypothetical protein
VIRPLRLGALALSAAVMLAGCGGSGDGGGESGEGQGAEVRGDADSGDVEVIDAWSSALRDGDVEGAAGYFALPSVAENGPTLVRIGSRAEAELFNRSLPCGAELIHASSEGDFTIATFRLTERPGPGACGTGVGELAKTSFLIEDGLIAEWRRVAIGNAAPPGEVT